MIVRNAKTVKTPQIASLKLPKAILSTSITIPDSLGSFNENVFTGSLRNVTRISIGANVNLDGYNDVVWRGFSTFYRVNGNRAGTYTLSNGKWSAQYR